MVSFLFGVFLSKFYFNRWFPFVDEKTNFFFFSFSFFLGRVNYVPLSNEKKKKIFVVIRYLAAESAPLEQR